MIRLTALKVTLHFRSGLKLRFLTDSITKSYQANNLGRLEGGHTVGWPFYFDLDQVEAVTARRVLCVRWLS